MEPRSRTVSSLSPRAPRLDTKWPRRSVSLAGGFSLIELLVVIAVIAVLAALLLPVLSKAKQRAQVVKCLSNLHQIGLGMQIYVNEHKDIFPPAATQQINPTLAWDSLENYWIGNFLGGNDPAPTDSPHVPLAKDRLLNSYVTAHQAWVCPADHGFGPSIHPTTAGVLGNSYRFNWSLEGD